MAALAGAAAVATAARDRAEERRLVAEGERANALLESPLQWEDALAAAVAAAAPAVRAGAPLPPELSLALVRAAWAASPDVPLRGHEAAITWAAFTPDGARVRTASADGALRAWTAPGGETAAATRLAGRPLAVAPDGRRAVTIAGEDAALVSTDPSAPRLALLGHRGPVETAAFSADGERALTMARGDPAPRVWDARTGRASVVLRGHGDSVRTAVFAPGSVRVMTSSDDGTVRVWDARSSGTPGSPAPPRPPAARPERPFLPEA